MATTYINVLAEDLISQLAPNGVDWNVITLDEVQAICRCLEAGVLCSAKLRTTKTDQDLRGLVKIEGSFSKDSNSVQISGFAKATAIEVREYYADGSEEGYGRWFEFNNLYVEIKTNRLGT